MELAQRLQVNDLETVMWVYDRKDSLLNASSSSTTRRFTALITEDDLTKSLWRLRETCLLEHSEKPAFGPSCMKYRDASTI